MSKNFYEILEVSRSSSADEIKKSYRRLAMKYHPDRTNNDKIKEEKFKIIKKAYETLSDEYKRKEYDFTLLTDNSIKQENHFESKDNINTKEQETFIFNGKEFFHYHLNCQFEDVFFGIKKIISVMIKNQIVQLEVIIPKGIFPNDFFIIEYDNFFIKYIVVYHEHIFFKRDGLDIQTKISIDIFDAILGVHKKLTFKTIEKEINLEIPPYSQNGDKIIIKNGGFQQNFLFGHLILEISILMPTHLSPEIIHILEKIKNREQLKNKIFYHPKIIFIASFVLGSLLSYLLFG